MVHRGEKLRKFFDANGIKYAKAARNIGVHKNTICNWLTYPDLDDQKIVAISKRYPDIKEAFPEIYWSSYVPLVSEVRESYVEYNKLSPYCIKVINEWKDKYIILIDRYNELLEKHSQLLEQSLSGNDI